MHFVRCVILRCQFNTLERLSHMFRYASIYICIQASRQVYFCARINCICNERGCFLIRFDVEKRRKMASGKNILYFLTKGILFRTCRVYLNSSLCPNNNLHPKLQEFTTVQTLKIQKRTKFGPKIFGLFFLF